MIWNQLDLNSRLEAALRAVTPQAAQWYGEYASLLATKVDARWRERAGSEWASEMFEGRVQHTKCMHACLLLGSHRCLLEMLHWAYGSWVARGLAVDRFRVEMEAWREVVKEEAGSRADGVALAHLYDVLVEAHETFCAMAGRGFGDPFGGEQLPKDAQAFLASLLTGKEPAVEAQPNLPGWWEGVVGPAMRTVGKLWSEGCVSVAEEHVATAIVQQVMRRSLPAETGQSREQSLAVVVPAGEWHTVGAEIVRDFLRVQGYRVFYTGANTPLDGLVQLVEWNGISCVLISSTMTPGLLQVSEMVERFRGQMGPRCPRIVVGGQAYRLDPGLAKKVGADACIQGLEELGDYLQRNSPAQCAGSPGGTRVPEHTGGRPGL